MFWKDFDFKIANLADMVGGQLELIGDIAQLVEHLNGIQEASGSSPLISTMNCDHAIISQIEVSKWGVISINPAMDNNNLWYVTQKLVL